MNNYMNDLSYIGLVDKWYDPTRHLRSDTGLFFFSKFSARADGKRRGLAQRWVASEGYRGDASLRTLRSARVSRRFAVGARRENEKKEGARREN